jgi:hypothetical protein
MGNRILVGTIGILAALAVGVHAGPLAPKLEAVLKDAPSDALIPVIVQTRVQGDLRSLPVLSSYDDKVAYLRAIAAEAQQDLLSWLRTVPAEDIKPLWLVSSTIRSGWTYSGPTEQPAMRPTTRHGTSTVSRQIPAGLMAMTVLASWSGTLIPASR